MSNETEISGKVDASFEKNGSVGCMFTKLNKFQRKRNFTNLDYIAVSVYITYPGLRKEAIKLKLVNRSYLLHLSVLKTANLTRCVSRVSGFWGHSIFESIQNPNIVKESMNSYIAVVH